MYNNIYIYIYIIYIIYIYICIIYFLYMNIYTHRNSTTNNDSRTWSKPTPRRRPAGARRLAPGAWGS